MKLPFVLLIPFAAAAARGDLNPEAFRFHRPIADTVDSRSLAAVEPDVPIWEAVSGVLERIRLVDGDNRPVPYLVRRENETETVVRRTHLETRVEGMERLPDNRIAFTVEVDADTARVDGLELDIPMENFERRVSVYGLSGDGSETLLVEDRLLYDYSRYLDVRNTEIELPEHDFTRFRVRVEEADAETATPYRRWAQTLKDGEAVESREWRTLVDRPLRIDAVRAFNRIEENIPGQPKRAPIPGLTWKSVETGERDVTVLELDTRHAPVSSLTLRAADPVYSREVEVRVPAGERWRTVERGRLTRIAYRDTLREETEIRFEARREPRLRLGIHNRGNPPLEVEDLAAAGPVWRVVFLAEAGAQYRLLYGAAKPERAEYDTHSIRELLEAGHEPERLALGEPVEREMAPSEGPRFLSSPAFLYLAILVVAVVIGFGLYRAARTME